MNVMLYLLPCPDLPDLMEQFDSSRLHALFSFERVFLPFGHFDLTQFFTLLPPRLQSFSNQSRPLPPRTLADGLQFVGYTTAVESHLR